MHLKFATAILLMNSLLAVVVCPRSGVAAASQDASSWQVLTIDFLQMPGLPLSIASPMLAQTENGYVLRGYISNSSDDRIVGLRDHGLCASNSQQTKDSQR